jgi:late competence protein required for DNA uptake (superfamily II DNA/RNA helicase)
MASGEIMVTCPQCQNRASIPIAAVKRDNYYCSKCLQKIPMQSVRPYDQLGAAPPAARPKKSARGYRR